MNEVDFKKKLNAEQYRVMREKDTERPFSGKYWDNDESGLYSCAMCASPLFVSIHKFDAGLGWPTFRAPLRKDGVELSEKDTEGKSEVCCKKCGGHLGYLVPNEDESKKPYYRINSASLSFHAMPEIDLPQTDDDANVESQKPQLEQWADQIGSFVSQFSPAALISSGIALVLGAVVAGASVASLCTSAAPASVTTTTTATMQTTVTAPVVVTPPPATPKKAASVSPATSSAALATSSPNSSTSPATTTAGTASGTGTP